MRRISIAILFILIIGFSGCSKQVDYIPEKFSDLTLQQKYIGDEARKFVDRLHYQPVAPVENKIGFYENAQASAIIYITFYDDNEDAVDDFKRMTVKISPDNSVFYNSSYLEKEGNRIYKTFGMGQTHYVFVLDDKLFWISVNDLIAENFFDKYYDFID